MGGYRVNTQQVEVKTINTSIGGFISTVGSTSLSVFVVLGPFAQISLSLQVSPISIFFLFLS
jgi:hypothetical protein